MRASIFHRAGIVRASIIGIALLASAGAALPPENFYWDGLNPFFQPARTLNFYGSGDVDNNCRVDGRDLDSLEHSVALHATTNYRADVNGDGVISPLDVALLKAHLEKGATLPAHWNYLTEEQRVDWLNRCLALDITSGIPAAEDNFVCGNFASQFYFNFSYFGGNLSHTTYTGGGTIFNIPVYSITLPGHAINAVLVGDDPLRFKNWYFIEPQKATIIDPVPPGEGISFSVVTYVIQSAQYSNEIITATRTQDGWTVQKTATGFITSRPPPPPDTTACIDMIPSWNPRVMRMENTPPVIFFERLNDRLPPSTSIVMASLVNGVISDITPLVFDTLAARLFDVRRSPDGTAYILWRGTRDFRPALFTGAIDVGSKTVVNAAVFAGAGLAKAGALASASGQSRDVFWLSDQPDSAAPQGINQCTMANGNWSAPQNVDAFAGSYFVPSPSWSNHVACNYLMNVLSLQGKPVVLSVPQPWQSSTSTIHVRFPSGGGWSDFPLEDDSLVTGARAAVDRDNTIHCVYWATYRGSVRLPEGKVVYRSFKGSTWSNPLILDSSVNNRCADIVVNDRGDLLTAWERAVSKDRAALCTRVYCKGSWRSAEIRYAPENESVWYPRLTALHDTNFIVAWESRGKYTTQVRWTQCSYSPDYLASPKRNAAESPIKFSARLQGGRVLVTLSGTAPTFGSVAIFDARGVMIHKTLNTDVRHILFDRRTIGSGLRFVTLRAGNEKYIAKITLGPQCSQ